MFVSDLLARLPLQPSLGISIAACIFVSLVVGLLARRPSFPAGAPQLVKDSFPLIGALGFWTKRCDFFLEQGAHSPTGNFSYYLGNHRVVGLTGEASRKAFFESRDLDFNDGYRVLFGQGPEQKKVAGAGADDGDELSEGFSQQFTRRLVHLLKREFFASSLPHLISDMRKRLDELAASPSGITDPFESIYGIVFQLTMRVVGAKEIASDPPLLKKVLGLFEEIERSATVTTILFPWIPTPALARRAIAGSRLYMIFQRIVKDRQTTGRREEDPLQYLLDQGDSVLEVITFVVSALFAGQLNSGINAAYVMVYLAHSPHWLAEARREVETVAARHCPDRSAPLTEQLAHVPIDAWETEFTLIDLCLRDSIRLQLLGAAIRRNMSGKDLKIGGEIVPNGAFATYHLADIHMDPAVYRDPEKWDPSRYMSSPPPLPPAAAAGAANGNDHAKAGPYAPYLGWGAGRHPCLGMRFAKLEQNIIVAYFLAYFDVALCDAAGRPSSTLPTVDRNGYSAMKPRSPVFLRCSPRR